MKPFKRGGEEYKEEFEEKDERRSVNNKSSVRSRGKREKKQKPWGKPERILILIILIFAVGVSGFLAMNSRSWNLPVLSPTGLFKMLSIPFLSDETGNEKNIEKKEKITSEFVNMTKDLTGVYGLYVINLNDGFSFGVNDTDEFEPASLNKLPVMAALYLESEYGNIDLDIKYTLKESDKISGSGNLSSKPAGTEISYRGLLREMGKQSDNTAFAIVRNYLGDKKIDSAITKIGMSNTSIEENRTTPQDTGMLFERLYQGEVVNDANKGEFLGFLTDTAFESGISAGVPENIHVAHKFGREVNVINDAGIVYTELPYVIVFLSKGIAEDVAADILVETSILVYQTLSQK